MYMYFSVFCVYQHFVSKLYRIVMSVPRYVLNCDFPVQLQLNLRWKHTDLVSVTQVH